jgi:hypothetical protein
MEISGSKENLFKQYCRKKLSIEKEFIKLFYNVLYLSDSEGKDITPRQAFEILNKLYFNLTGKYRYKTYELFLLARIRMENKMRRKQFMIEGI